jgi:hypothetical protein
VPYCGMATFTLIVTMMFTNTSAWGTYAFATVPGYRTAASCWEGAKQFKRDHGQIGVSFQHFSCQKVN